MLDYASLKQAFEETSLFESKTWRLSPEAWPISPQDLETIQQIGEACFAFQVALENLYTRSWQDKNLLRNTPLKAPWVAEYLDRNKPPPLIEHARSKRLRGRTPLILRPDLLMTEDGFALTEMDSVPGGIGLTAFLNDLYNVGAEVSIIGSREGMEDAFYECLASTVAERTFPFVAILVSDEAATYRPEMEWLAANLQRKGKRVFVFHTNEVMPLGNALCVGIDGDPQKIDIVYRFWELFDQANVAPMDHMLQIWDEGEVDVTPPMKPYQEEKMALGLFHHPRLEPYWRENLSKRAFKLLKQIIPQTWIVDPAPVPPFAVLDAPFIDGRPIHDWRQLADASKKERELILKISGFHETAWGARSVVYGADVSKEEWTQAIDNALNHPQNMLHILQEYRKPKRIEHPVYNDAGEIYSMQGRVRLCPYYFVQDDTVKLEGILSTFCPADKKIIHGMKDAALIPCRLQS